MSRDPYRGSAPDLGYAPRPQRWDADRFAAERGTRERFAEERETRLTRRPRERNVDYIEERRDSRGGDYEEERVREREYDYGPPPEERYAIPVRTRKQSVTIERERDREYYEEPPRRQMARPGLLRRQSSLDTFDRRPIFPREEYGPPARYRPEPAFVPIPAPLPRSRQLGPPRAYRERDFEEIRVAEPDYYGDEEYRPFPERIREREVVRRRRRSRSKESHVRSNSSSSSSEASVSVKPEFPKKGKTRMPSRLVSIKAVIDLGYPFEQEGETIVIQKALGRENIDEVIKLSEDYKTNIAPEIIPISMSGGRSQAGDVVEERREFTHTDAPGLHKTVEKTTIERRELSPARTTVSRSVSVGRSPHIIDAGPTFITEREVSAPMVVGPLVLAEHNHRKDERAIRAEIRALEAEKEALRAEKRASRELRRADRFRREGRESGEIVLYEETKIREREPEGGVRIEKDKKGPDPKAIKMLMKTLT